MEEKARGKDRVANEAVDRVEDRIISVAREQPLSRI
jgi:hypothetical protein|tara:strand:- start:159 stop:266 length:108 start_codon:yes stop_codon:yes gene_type:complete